MSDKLKPSVLLIEDSRIVAMVSSLILNEANCSVIIAETGASALESIRHNKFDLILMDIGLPDTDGAKLTLKIKEQENMRQVPVIALTAHNTEEIKQKCFNAGMKEVLKKPLDLKTVLRILKFYVKE